jgi:hypothetical protein
MAGMTPRHIRLPDTGPVTLDPRPDRGRGRPYADRVIAAHNSIAPDKENADYVCDGVDDQVEIGKAVADLQIHLYIDHDGNLTPDWDWFTQGPAAGQVPKPEGKVLLLAGDYFISGPEVREAWFGLTASSWWDVHIQGMGSQLTRLYEANNEPEQEEGQSHEAWRAAVENYWANEHQFGYEGQLPGNKAVLTTGAYSILSDLSVEAYSVATLRCGSNSIIRDCRFALMGYPGGPHHTEIINLRSGSGNVSWFNNEYHGGRIEAGAGEHRHQDCRMSGGATFYSAGGGDCMWANCDFAGGGDVSWSGGWCIFVGNRLKNPDFSQVSSAVIAGNYVEGTMTVGSIPDWSPGGYNGSCSITGNLITGDLILGHNNNVGGNSNQVLGSVIDNGTGNTGF